MKPLLPLFLIAGGAALLFRDQIAEYFTGNSYGPPLDILPSPETPTGQPPAEQPAGKGPVVLGPARPPTANKPYGTPEPSNTANKPVGNNNNNTANKPVGNPNPPRDTGLVLMPFQKTLQAAGINPESAQLTADTWNFYYTQASGREQTTDLFTPGNRGELMSMATYLRRRVSAGVEVASAMAGVRNNRRRALPGNGLKAWL